MTQPTQPSGRLPGQEGGGSEPFAAFTPGPWVWLERDHEAQYLYSTCEPAGGWVLNPQADVGDYGLSVNRWVDISLADARLIAAAPDLLSALQDAIADLEQTLHWRGEGWECTEDEPLPLTSQPARVIVCGGRDFYNRERVFEVMDRLHAIRPIEMLWHGNARGADFLGGLWGKERGVKVFAVPAEWSKHGKRAGPIRNQAMLGNSIDLVVAFPGGAGTEDMVRRAKRAGVLVIRALADAPMRASPPSSERSSPGRPHESPSK